MKTFKLVSLHVETKEEFLEVPLEDGLIINKEDERSSWLIEAYTNQSFHEHFTKLHESQTELVIHATITKKENNPAFFKMKVCSVRNLTTHISILLEGNLKRIRSNYAELLLEDLLAKGLTGDQLKEAFSEKMKTKPPILSK